MANAAVEGTYEIASDKEKIFITLLKAGMKPEEIIALRPEDVNEKGIREIKIPFEIMKGYISSSGRKIKQENYLFPGQKGGNMKSTNIALCLGRTAKKAGHILSELGFNIQKPKPVKTKIEFKSAKDLIAWLNEK